MTEKQLLQFPSSTLTPCPACGESAVTTSLESETFAYGRDDEATQISVEVPVGSCSACGFKFTDERAEEIRHAAVCRHLGVLTPDEVRERRDAYGLSRSQFSQIAGIGEASLARWENGALLQSRGYDQFLYLLGFPENFQRLRDRGGRDAKATPSIAPIGTKASFRFIQPTARDLERASAFELIPA